MISRTQSPGMCSFQKISGKKVLGMKWRNSKSTKLINFTGNEYFYDIKKLHMYISSFRIFKLSYTVCHIMKTPAFTPPASRWGTKITKQLWPWPNDLDLNPCEPVRWPLILTYDLVLDTRDLDLGPPFLIAGWKLEFLHFLPWWLWPLTYDLDLHTLPRYDGFQCACRIFGP